MGPLSSRLSSKLSSHQVAVRNSDPPLLPHNRDPALTIGWVKGGEAITVVTWKRPLHSRS
jgi:hypothetical protein